MNDDGFRQHLPNVPGCVPPACLPYSPFNMPSAFLRRGDQGVFPVNVSTVKVPTSALIFSAAFNNCHPEVDPLSRFKGPFNNDGNAPITFPAMKKPVKRKYDMTKRRTNAVMKKRGEIRDPNDTPPKPARCAWNFFFKTHYVQIRQENADGKSFNVKEAFVNIGAQLGDTWRSLPLEEKEIFENMAQDDKTRYVEETKRYRGRMDHKKIMDHFKDSEFDVQVEEKPVADILLVNLDDATSVGICLILFQLHKERTGSGNLTIDSASSEAEVETLIAKKAYRMVCMDIQSDDLLISMRRNNHTGFIAGVSTNSHLEEEIFLKNGADAIADGTSETPLANTLYSLLSQRKLQN